MAAHIKIKTPEDFAVHIDAPFGVDYTLCGLETSGDSGLGILAGVPTRERVNCVTCIRIVLFCKKVKAAELATDNH